MKSIPRGPCSVLAWALLWNAFLPWFVVGQKAGVPYTLDGYDVDGGTEPICWTMPVVNVTAETIRTEIYAMMPTCYPGLELVVATQTLTTDELEGVMFNGANYTFEVEASVDYAAIARMGPAYFTEGNQSYTLGDPVSPFFFFRIILCDISKIGFCNPVALELLEDNQTIIYSPTAIEEMYESASDVDLNYQEGTVIKGVQVGNHIYSRWINLTMDEINPTTGRFSQSINITMKIPEGPAGAFFVIGHGHFQVPLDGRNGSEAGLFVETADAIPNNVVEIMPLPQVLEVTSAMKIGLGVVSGVFALGALILLVFIVYHRENAVMRLSQWGFLSWIVLCALISLAFIFTYMPTKDWHCRLSEIFEFVPLTMIGAILVGRLWRVYVTLSQASRMGSEQSGEEQGYRLKRLIIGVLTQIARFPYGCREIGQHDKGFRQTATAMETLRLVLWLSLPQIIFQVVSAILYDKSLLIEYDSNLTLGRSVCDEDKMWSRRIGVILIWAVYTIAVLLAWVGRDLPSAFNETDGIFQSSSINAIVSLLAISIDLINSSVRTSPNVTVFLWASTTIIVCSTSVGFIVIPKVLRVMSGEKVIIGNLLKQGRPSQDSAVPAERRPTFSSSRIPVGEREPISLKRNEPIPKRLEQQLLQVHGLISDTRDRLLIQGRTPNLSEWHVLMENVDELHGDFDRLQFDWTEEDER